MSGALIETSLKQALPHLGALVLFALAVCGFYAKSFDGYSLRQGDVQNYRGMSKEMSDYRALTGDHAGWTGAMFSGMPTDQISADPHTISFAKSIQRSVSKLFGFGPMSTLWMAMISAYLLAIALGASPLVAMVCGLAFGFSSVNILYLGAGHNTKVRAIAMMPGVVAGVLWAYRKNMGIGLAIAAFFTAMHVVAGHPQMTYYLLYLLAAIGLTECFGQWRLGISWKELGKKSLLLIAAGLVGVLPSLSDLSATKSYAQFTTRGDQILQEANDGMMGEGLSDAYILEYSMADGEWWSIMCPDIKGGNDPLYWGEQTFSGGAFYFGAVICALCFVFFVAGRDRLKWPMMLIALLAILLSRRDPGVVMNFFLDYAPFFNQFRDTKMMLVLVQVVVTMGAALGLVEMLALAKQPKSDRVKWWLGSFGFLMVLFAGFYVMPEVFFGFQSEIRLDRVIDQLGRTAAIDARVDVFRSDVLRTLGLILVTGVGSAAMVLGWLRGMYFVVALILVSTLDLWSVDRRYSNEEAVNGAFRNWVKTFDAKYPFVPTAQMMGILQLEASRHPGLEDKASRLKDQYEEALGDLRMTRAEKDRLRFISKFGALRFEDHFRVLNWGSPFSDASASYFFQSVGGYHGAKLRRYQDFIERVLEPEHQKFVAAAQRNEAEKGLRSMVAHRMLNTRYILLNQMPEPLPIPEPNGPGWIASGWQQAASAEEEIAGVASMNDPKMAVIHEQYSAQIEGLAPGAIGSVELTSYSPDTLSYDVALDADGLVVFSEIWYPIGWTCTLNGQIEQPIRVNYLLRAMRVPKGNHEIIWSYGAPQRAGLAGIANMLLCLFIGGGLYFGLSRHGVKRNS